jgi:asparagine synthase (glutamine-hydrolysing)
MCGIAGGVWFGGSGATEARARVVADMTTALAHRGPDGHGVTVCAGASRADAPAIETVLGHRRLAIIDLSDRGAQPMASPRRPLWITYNGEIYNFRAVRRELEAAGRRFDSDSDSEVVLQGFEEWGPAVLDRLQGMFAFAIWDGDRNRLTLVRDRLGIKPLYVHRHAAGLLFASEIRGLLASGLVPRRLDRDALDLYLRYQTVPTPATLVRDVEMLPPATVVEIGPDGSRTDRGYWDLLGSASQDARRDSAVEQSRRVQSLLAESAALHLVSDVPVGVFLSGGIDSSAIVSLVREAGVRPRTFAVCFEGLAEDESAHARAVASAFDADHTEIALDDASLLGQLPEALAAVDHPSGDGINSYVVSRAVRAAGVKVALSGLGGDELFGGYPSFDRLTRLPAFAEFWKWTPPALRRAAAVAVRSLGRESVSAMKTASALEGDGSLPETFPVLRELFSPDQRDRLLGRRAAARRTAPDPYVELLRQAQADARGADVMALVSFAEARTYMHDVLLRDTDQMSMAHGLEVRVPLLDHRLAEYVMGLPAEAKLRGSGPKPLLVASLPRPLPASATQRPKRGFVLPFDTWMRGALRPYCEHHLGPAGLAGRGILDAAAVSSLWQTYQRGGPRTTWSRPWTLVALDAWLDQTGLSV